MKDMSETTKEEAQLLVSKHLSKQIQEWAGTGDEEAGEEFARLVVDALGLRVVAVEADAYMARIQINNINKETSSK